jgi:hypothetical protein
MGVRIGLLLKQDARRTKTEDKKYLRSVLGYIYCMTIKQMKKQEN